MILQSWSGVVSIAKGSRSPATVDPAPPLDPRSHASELLGVSGDLLSGDVESQPAEIPLAELIERSGGEPEVRLLRQRLIELLANNESLAAEPGRLERVLWLGGHCGPLSHVSSSASGGRVSGVMLLPH